MMHDDKLTTIRAMKAYGGGFVKSLAGTYLLADDDNARKIEAAFPEYLLKYGPGSDMFDAISQVEA